VDGHDALYCHWCRKVTPYTVGDKPRKCPMCEHPYDYRLECAPVPTRNPRQEQINPMTGRGEESGDQYKMVHDWDRGWVWQDDLGMK
jgi:hypothetical protein